MVGEAAVKIRESRTGQPGDSPRCRAGRERTLFVYVVANGRAERREVEIGVDNGDQVEIVSGLKPGEQVVVSGQHMLADGAPVEVK